MNRPIRLRAHTFGLLFSLAAGSVSSLAAAQSAGPKAALVVTRGEGAQDCPDAAALAERVRGVAGARVISAELGAAPFETWVQVAIARNFGGYSAQISTSGARHGTRVLEDLGPSCASLADATAVTLAIFLDPYANAPTVVPPALAVAASSPEPKSTPKSNAPRAVPRRARFFVAGSAGVTLDVLEHAVPLFTANAGFRFSPSWSLSLGGGFLLSDTVTSAGGEVALGLAHADLAGCGRALGEAERAHLDWCLTAMLGSLGGSGRGYANGFSKRATWLAAGVGPQIVFPFARAVSWVLGGQAVMPLIRNGFDVEANGARNPAFRPNAVGAIISLGVRGDL